MYGVTKRQWEVLDFLRSFIGREGYSPSYRQIQSYFGFSSIGTVQKHLQALKRKGLIVSETGSSRSISLKSVPTDRTSTPIPYRGTVSPGALFEYIDSSTSLHVPNYLLTFAQDPFLISIQGDSLLSEEGMLDGDILIVDQCEIVPGDLVFATIESMAVISRLFRKNGKVLFESSKKDGLPLSVSEEIVQIQGKIVSLMRNYSS